MALNILEHIYIWPTFPRLTHSLDHTSTETTWVFHISGYITLHERQVSDPSTVYSEGIRMIRTS